MEGDVIKAKSSLDNYMTSSNDINDMLAPAV